MLYYYYHIDHFDHNRSSKITSEVIRVLTESACASIRYRVRNEILEDNPDIADYLDEILNDERVKYVFTWQTADGYLGKNFHAGWIPDAKLKLYNTGSESALRFLSEMGVPSNYPVVEKGLNALLKDNWFSDPWKWIAVYEPEIGLFGIDYLRAVVFSYFGIEEYDFIKTEIQRALVVIDRVTEIRSIKDVTGTYRDRLYFNQGITLPDLYHLKLLAFTKGWRNGRNTGALAKAIEHLIELSPLPEIYIKCGNQLVAPARITPCDLKQSPHSLQPGDWYWWLHTMELFTRMGIVNQVPALRQQVAELKEMLAQGNGFFPVKPPARSFQNWSVHLGSALEDSWNKNRWRFDLTFRAFLILKYAEMFEQDL